MLRTLTSSGFLSERNTRLEVPLPAMEMLQSYSIVLRLHVVYVLYYMKFIDVSFYTPLLLLIFFFSPEIFIMRIESDLLGLSIISD